MIQYNPHQSEQTNSEKDGHVSECVLEVCQDITPMSGHTVIEEGKWQAIEVAEAMLVWVMTVISSVFTVHTQVPFTCRDRDTDQKHKDKRQQCEYKSDFCNENCLIF